MLKDLYEERQKEKEEKNKEQKLLNEINQFKEKLKINNKEIENKELEINNIDVEKTDNYDSEDSETYTEILTNTKNLEINEKQEVINEENLENIKT